MCYVLINQQSFATLKLSKNEISQTRKRILFISLLQYFVLLIIFQIKTKLRHCIHLHKLYNAKNNSFM